MQSLLLPHLVDDLEDARVQSGILDSELLGKPAPVDEVVARVFAPAVFRERDLRVRQKSTNDVRELTEADGDAARVVERMARSVGQKDSREDLGHVLHVD